MKYPVQRPHDKFFKETLGEAAIAQDFLKNYLPASLAKQMDFSTLTLQHGSFIDKHLKEYFTDLLYRVQLQGKDSYLYFLLEHKSYPDPDISLQLLSYVASIYQHLRKEQPKSKLPPVIPLVFYHGKEQWQIRTEFSALIAGYEDLPQEVKRCIPHVAYQLYDLRSYEENDLQGEVPLLLALRTLKFIFENEERFLQSFLETVRLLESLPDASQRAMRFERLMSYVLMARKQIDLQQMNQQMQQISIERGEQLMSMAHKLWQEGKMEGKMEGFEEKALEIAKNMLAMGSEVPFIVRATGLSQEQIHRLDLEIKKDANGSSIK